MGHGTFQAKFVPLSQLEEVEKIYVVRKTPGPEIDKLEYIVLPRWCRFSLFHVLMAPFVLALNAKKKKADLILAYHMIPYLLFAWFASKLTGIPFIFAQTGSECQLLVKKHFIGKFLLFCLTRAHLIFVPGDSSYRFWCSFGLEKKLRILHSSIDVERFSPKKKKCQTDILFVGRLSYEKQVDLVLKGSVSLVEKNPSLRIRIIGDGPKKRELIGLSEELSLSGNVVFTGFRENILSDLNHAKIFIMTSSMEGLPVALMEAMACEMLVIAPAVGNIPTILKDRKTGLLLQSTTTESVSLALEDAYENYDHYDQLRKNARQMIVDNYSYESAKKKWREIFQAI